jgi:hypothetical protein
MAWHTSWISASRTSHREAMGKAVAKQGVGIVALCPVSVMTG